MNVERLMKMAGAVRTGGKGIVRRSFYLPLSAYFWWPHSHSFVELVPERKKKAVHKATTTDDKRFQSTLKRIGVNDIPAIEEVNIFKDFFVAVQASIAANTRVVSGSPQTKKLQDILPGIINQLGPDNLYNLRKLAEQFQKRVPSGATPAGAPAAQEDDNDDVPELVAGETFEAAAEEAPKS